MFAMILADLTFKHYAEKCVTHVNHQIMKAKIISGGMYKAALVIVVQWCQPILNISSMSMAKQLDNLATSSTKSPFRPV